MNLSAHATDDRGNVAISSPKISITVTEGNVPSLSNFTVVNLNGAAAFTAGDVMVITVDANDADGELASVDIFNGPTLLGTAIATASTDQATTYRLDYTTSQAGVLQLNARATDNSSNTSISATYPVTVLPLKNTPPVVGVVSTPAEIITVGSTIPLTVSAGDIDGPLSSVNFFNGNKPIGAGTSVGSDIYALDWIPDAVGVYSIYAVAADSSGFQSQSSENVEITVNSAIGLVLMLISQHTHHLLPLEF